MKVRQLIITGVGLLLVAVVIVASRTLGSDADTEEAEEQAQATVVKLLTVANEDIQETIPITGRLISRKIVDLYAEVSGVSRYGVRPFKAGNNFARGEVLLRIDDSEFRSNLVSRKSQFVSGLANVVPDLKIDYPEIYPQWREYLLNLDIDKPLPSLPEVNDDQQKLFLTGRSIYANYYSLKEAENRLSKYRLVAPFSGTLTEADLDEGTLVRNGQMLGEFMLTGSYELEAAVSPSDLAFVKRGQQIDLFLVGSNEPFLGRVSRINQKVDEDTQLIRVYFSLNHPDLKAGMYLEGEIPSRQYSQASRIPREALVNNNSVFINEEGKATLQPVQTLHRVRDYVIVEGIPDGAEIVAEQRTQGFAGTVISSVNN